ncbi:5-methylcytosine restriction system specificity protein McrC [Ruminococcus flavefaciens]|uniref:5-methylcytosine restriction system specificity protein McrC n=1 Tax=Ruminococcus flavefaciens TaxID=1265 RepID=UPI00048C7659|nr:hypothetical protein [Ruminococcus flavefaciens]
MANEIEYTAQDCLAVSRNGKPVEKVDDVFLSYMRDSTKSLYCFNMSKSERDKEPEPIVVYDYKDKQWRAGRYIGDIHYSDGRKHYSLTILPRFGEKILMEMFGEIFKINLTGGRSRFNYDTKNIYIKLLVSLIWSQKLAEASRHGLPRKRVTNDNKGYIIKGKLLIKPSIFSYCKDQTVISRSYEMAYDEKVIAIISSAYRVLKAEYDFEQLSVSPNIMNTITDIESLGHALKYQCMTESDYHSISYHPIYQSFKDLVDFSWQIIKSSTRIDNQSKGLNVSGYLIDMAEVWECYVRSLVQKQLKEFGWNLIDSTFTVYENSFFQRKIIPDIVLFKDGEYCVFDAKYKKMEYRNDDVDREDFFQIHTYISYMQQLGNVKLAGLLYPIKKEITTATACSHLFGLNNKCQFIIDGPNIGSETVIKDRFFSVLMERTK